ncbi:MAG: DUF166 family protein [Archaeoglobaceae archaeon]
MKIVVVARRGTRKREIELFSRHFDVYVHEIPAELPELIEEPEELVKLPEGVEADIVISFAAHPDVNLAVLREAARRGVKLVVFSGGSAAGSYAQLKKEGERLGVKVIWEEICCATPAVEGFEEFFSKFGSPEVEVELEGDKIKDVRVLRSAFCGATYFVAEKLRGARIDEAGRLAGFYTQIYPCMASRGIEGGIHKAARAHKSALERAIKKALS